MSLHPSEHRALADLLWDYLHGGLSAERARAFAEALGRDADAARWCAHHAELLVLTRELFQNQDAARCEATLDPPLASPAPRKSSAAVTAAVLAKLDEQQNPEPAPLEMDPPFSMTAELPGQRRRRIRRQKRLAAAAIAAAATIACTLLAVLIASLVQPTAPTPQTAQTHPEPGPAEPGLAEPGRVGPEDPTPAPTPTRAQVVATLTNTHHAQWGGAASAALKPGTKLHPNTRLTLTAGFAEITTARGAVAILEAPATVELLDHDNAIRLHAGKLVGLCHTDSSKGFVVKTDHADITDLGTEFGVTARPDGVEASVFVGEVAVNTADTPSQVIQHSQTARVSVDQGRPTLVIEDKPATGYAQRLPRPALITDASINLPGFKVEVVPNGVYEDTRLYTDRDHEINGVDAAGLPSPLIGGDLVRMPADARPDRAATERSDELSLEIELAQPADVYILISPGTASGGWLERDYVRTGLMAGLDHIGGRREGGTGTPVEGGRGPGASIDLMLEVWKRKQTEAGRVAVGGPMSNSMYAIVAVQAARDKP